MNVLAECFKTSIFILIQDLRNYHAPSSIDRPHLCVDLD